MKTYIIQVLITSIISFFLVIFIGEPVKHFIMKFITHKEIEFDNKQLTNKLIKLMPKLLTEMKDDYKKYPLNREFILLTKGVIYNGESICYYYEEHENLKEKMDILENYNLIYNITYNNTTRFKMTEQFINILHKIEI